MSNNKTEITKTRPIINIIFTIICVILVVILTFNFTIIIKGTANPDEPPSVFGVIPLVTVSGSMTGENKDSFPTGSLVVMIKCNTSELEAGTVIAYHDPASKTKSAIVSHRIVEIVNNNDGTRSFYVKGDANNDRDKDPIPAANVVGRYSFHINKVGDFALFLQKPLGMIIFIGIPVIAFILYDIIRRKLDDKKRNKRASDLETELDRLRAERAALVCNGNVAAPGANNACTDNETPVAKAPETPIVTGEPGSEQ